LKPVKRKFDKLSKKLSELLVSKTEKEGNLSGLKNEIEKTVQEIKQLEEQIPERTEIKKVQRESRQLERKKDRLGRRKAGVEADLRNIRKLMKDLRRKLKEVKGKKRCPVCLQVIIDPSDVEKHYNKENKKLLSQQKRKQSLLEKIATELNLTTKKFEKVDGTLTDLQNRFNKKQLVKRAKKTLKSLETRRRRTRKVIQTCAAKTEKQKDSISKLNFDDKSYATDESTLSTLRKQKIAEKYSKARAEVKQLPEVNKGLTTLHKTLERLNMKRKSLESKMILFGDIEKNYKKARRNLENAQKALGQSRVQLATQKANKRNTWKQLKERFGKKKSLKENEKKIRYLGKERILLEELRNVFKNIPENILRRLRPYIEKEGNDLITELSDSEITALNIQKETLNVAATMTGEVRPIHYFSEGQKTRIQGGIEAGAPRERTPQGWPNMPARAVSAGEALTSCRLSSWVFWPVWPRPWLHRRA